MKERSEVILTITPEGAGDLTSYLKEALSCWQLACVLGWRDIIVRYKQTLLGFGWALLKPLSQFAIYAFVFGQIAGLSNSTPVPYVLFVFSGVIAWQLFSSCLTASADSIVSNAGLVGKVYFPRIVLTVSATAAHLADYATALLMLLPMVQIIGDGISLKILLLPFVSIFVALLGLSIGTILAPLNAKFRDIRSIVPMILQVASFITPIGYNAQALPEKLKWAMAANPMTHVIELFRWVLFDNYPLPNFVAIAIIALSGFAALCFGVLSIRTREKEVSDVL